MMQEGLLFARPDGKFETIDERDRRLAHNARMRFNRSFDSTLSEFKACRDKSISQDVSMSSCLDTEAPESKRSEPLS